jgi:8-amino-7-oxononanoate synthase
VERSTPPSLSFLDEKLEDARARGLLRVRVAPGATSALSYCSNDYLGLAGRTGARERAGSGASRLVHGDLPVHARLEEACAGLVLQPHALTFTSGYAANVGLLAALAGPGDLIVSDAWNHASIVDGARLSRARIAVVPHLDIAATERALAGRHGGRAFVVTESYFSMDADSPDLAGLRKVCDTHGAALLVDEAHALGVLGPEGRGLCAEAGVRADAVVGTFGKAFGAAGAFVAGCAALQAWLWNRARPFVFSTGLAPVLAATALEGVLLAGREPERRRRLLEATRQMRSGMLELGVTLGGHGPIMPWVVGEPAAAMALAEALGAEGYDVRAIRPPTVPEGSARLRLTVTAAHGAEEVGGFLEAVKRLQARGIGTRPLLQSARKDRADGEPEGGAARVRKPGPLVVVTGTGTEIGKTHVAEALLRAWGRHEPEARLVGLKPVESGVSAEAKTDAARLASASTFHVKQSGYALRAPLSPHLAARAEGIEIDLGRVLASVDGARREADGVILELPGGLFTPIAPGKSNADLLATLSPDCVLLVAPNRLGVLHDVAAATRAARTIPVRIHGVILNAPETADASTGSNAAELTTTTGAVLLATLPRAPSAELATLLDWPRIVQGTPADR